jgi:hypothetical protein
MDDKMAKAFYKVYLHLQAIGGVVVAGDILGSGQTPSGTSSRSNILGRYY